jgi:hypothetical protein
VTLLLAVGYVVHLRLQARRRLDIQRRRTAASRSATARMRRLDSADRVFAVRSDRLAREVAEVRAAADEATRAAAEAVTSRVADRAAPDADGWQPVPVPLPTYVTKPKAVRTTRTIDLGSPGVWSSGRGEDAPAEQAAPPAEQPAAPEPVRPSYEPAPVVAGVDDDEDDELDAILERRRAVND